jgi:hypothetical protein
LIASDVATQLTSILPKYTDVLSDIFTITSLVNAANVSTATTSTPHGLDIGDPVIITDTLVPITQSTLSRVLTVGTLVTSSDHDLTKAIALTITITGAADSNFNGTFTVIQIVNRRTIKFTIADSNAISTTGASLQIAASYLQGYNGSFQVLEIISTTVFTVATVGALPGTSTSGKVKINTRISAAATVERAFNSYTEQPVNKMWLFVVIGTTTASKDRNTNTDMTAVIGRSNYFRQQLIERVTVYAITNTKDEIAGRVVRDEMTDLLVSITKSICFHQFPTNFTVQLSEPLIFVDHNLFSYDGAVYIHEFNFECSTEFTFDDTVGYDPDVAFRDIDSTYDNTLGTGQTSDIPANANDTMDLDEEP